MSAPAHHLPDELLVDHGSGAAPEAISVLVASHLSVCAICRRREATIDELGGLFLDAAAGAPPPGGLEEVVARLDEPVPPAPPEPSYDHPDWAIVPAPVRPYIRRRPGGGIAWTFRSPLSRYVDLPLFHHGTPVRIASLRGGSVFPRHTHDGEELTMVLQGGYDDSAGDTYLPGDVAVVDETITHQLAIHPGEDCVLLLLLENRLVPKSFRSKLISTFFPV